MELPRQYAGTIIQRGFKATRLIYTHHLLAILASSIQGPKDVCSLHATCATIRASAACMPTLQPVMSTQPNAQRLPPQLPHSHEPTMRDAPAGELLAQEACQLHV